MFDAAATASSATADTTSIASSSLNSATLPRSSAAKNRSKLTFNQPQQQLQNSSSSSTSNRSFIRFCQKAKRVRFFRNGDQYFKGIWYAISPERFRSFEALLEDLTKSLVDFINLPHGVRYLFTMDGLDKIYQLDHLKDGESYVCSSMEIYKQIDYKNAREPVWSYALPKSNGYMEAAALSLDANSQIVQEPTEFVRPKIITVIRNGVKPRRVVRLLLNKRTARTFRQVLTDITAAVKLDSGVVRKVFNLDGKLISSLSDFFTEDDVFVAYGTEKMSIDDFYLDSEEYKFLFSVRGRSSRSAKSPKFAHHLKLNNGNVLSPSLRRRFLHQRNQALLKPRLAKPSPSRECKQNGNKLVEQTSNQEKTTIEDESVCPHPFEIEDRFAIGRLIGDGNFAVVHEAICKKTKKRLALKIIDKANCLGKEELVENEVAILRQLDHMHIVQLYDVYDFEYSYYLTMELVAGGDLFDSLCSVRQYSEPDAAHLMKSLTSALDYLHCNTIVHRDVKPENLLIYQSEDGRKQLKLADFGLAIDASKTLYILCGTPTYVAPEILAELGYGTKVDIWAAGVIMYVMLCGFPPFQSLQGNQEELFDQIIHGHYQFPSPCWDGISSAAKGLIQGMLQLDVEDRYSAEEVLIHPWISGAAKVDPEYEKLAAIAVQSQIRSETANNSQPSRSFYDSDNVEYYYSRRRSMDDLSVRSTQLEDANDLSEFEVSFEYYENIADAQSSAEIKSIPSD